jgi:hypothetical protein
MNIALTNDLLLAFQLVSEKEKKKNKKLVNITKNISKIFLKLKKTSKKAYNAKK